MKKTKRIISFMMSIIMLCSMISFNSLAESEESNDQAETVSHILTIEGTEHGSVEIKESGSNITRLEENKYSILQGSKIEVILKPMDGYKAESVQLNEDGLIMKDTNTTFIMPSEDSSLSCTFVAMDSEKSLPYGKSTESDEVLDGKEHAEETDKAVQEGEPETKAEDVDDTKNIIPDASEDAPVERLSLKVSIETPGGKVLLTDEDGNEYDAADFQSGKVEFPSNTTIQLQAIPNKGYRIRSIQFLKGDNATERIDSSSDLNQSDSYKKEIMMDRSVDGVAVSFEKQTKLKTDIIGMNLGIDVTSFQLERTTTSRGIPNVGDTITGTCYIYDTWMEGSQSYFNIGDFTGDLADCYVTERIECLDHTAAAPSYTTASYEATVTEVNMSAGYIEYSIYVTPPGVTDGISRDENGNLYGYQHVGGKVRVPRQFVGSLDLYKASAKPEITDGNNCYSLEGAEYGLYRDGKLVKSAKTNSVGYAQFQDVEAAKYILKEINPPKGYALDTKEYSVTINSGQATRMDVKDYPQNDPIGILLGKIDAATNKNRPQGSASLANAEFTIKYYSGYYDSDPAESGVAAVRTWVFRTDEDGFTVCDAAYKVSGDDLYMNSRGTAVFPMGTVTIQETKAPSGYLINHEVFVRKITSDGMTESVFTYNEPSVPETVLKGGVKVAKWDADKDSDQPQGEGTLAGAKFQIISKNAEVVVIEGKSYNNGESVMTIITNSKGIAQTAANALPYGKYLLKEVTPPTGYQNTGVLEREFSITKNAEIVELTTSDTAIKNDIIRGGVQIEKWDSELDQNKPQGSATLEGARFQIVTLNENAVIVAGKVYQKNDVVTVLTTDENGAAETESDFLPYGTYQCKEIEPPEGYNSTGVLERTFSIRKQGDVVRLNTTDTAIKNDIIRGDLQLVKFEEDTDEEEDQKTPLEGIVFTITSKTTGKAVEIVTDKHGYASTKQLNISQRGNLVYDTYIVHESSKVDGLKPVKDFEITIKNEGETLYYILEDKQIVAPVRLAKVDSTTGKQIPLADAEFQLLDENMKPITMTTHYPQEIIHKTFKTDESGSFTLPEKLKTGTYYWRELNAPEGYLLGQDLKFEVEDGYDWEEPIIITYADIPAMGKIVIHKADDETGASIAGTKFQIKAKENIVAADGTIRHPKGEVVDTVTTDSSGTAESKALYLGKYVVQEVEQTGGYILDGKAHAVELEYKDQTTELVMESVSITNKPTKIKLTKTGKDTKKPLANVSFKVWNKAMEENPDPEMGNPEIYTTDEEGTILLQYLLPGTYCIQEIKTVPGYVLDGTIHEIVVSDDGKIDGKEVGVLEIENLRTELIGTKAKDKDTTTQESVPKKDTSFIDTVEFKNLQVGEEYTIKGTLMDKSTGEPLLVNGKEITAEKIFNAQTADGTIDVEFVFDASGLKGKELVVFEKAYVQGVEIASHEDLEDEGQTIRFPETEIGTTARDKGTGTQEAITKKKTTIIDTVKYRNLIIGQTYTIKGTLMDKDTENPLMVDGKGVTAEKTFLAEKKDGNVGLEFTFDASGLKGKETVVFEKLLADETEVAVHEDIEDREQTIRFPEHKIKTTAKDAETGTQEAIAKKKTTIIDTVQYTNLIPGQKYSLKGVLMDKTTGKELLADGKGIVSECTFTPDKSEGSVDMEFTFNSSELNNRSVVVFEYLYVDGEEIAAHADIEDEGQTVKIRVGKLVTSMPGNKNSGVIGPKTGDEIPAGFIGILALLCVSGGAVFLLVKYRRKKNEE